LGHEEEKNETKERAHCGIFDVIAKPETTGECGKF
jgi:hypothetical protein